MNHSTSHLQPDGTTFPPVTPDPPPPPGWVDPLAPLEGEAEVAVDTAEDDTSTSGGEHRAGPGA
ncbi:hypothetical protein [Knoellia flava]|nr:hypothetical protein [Knoellia flava]